MKKFLTAADGRVSLFWRLLIYISLYFVIALMANQITYSLKQKQPDSPSVLVELAFAVVLVSCIAGLTYFFRRRIDQQPWSGMALPSLRERWFELFTGGLWMPILMPAPLILLACALGQIQFVGTELAESGLLISALFVLAGLLNNFAIGFCEELVMRGYVFQNLAERYSLWLATLFTGLLFGLLHFWNGLTVASVLSLAAFSTVFVTLRLCTGSIWAAIGLHTAYNWAYTSLLGFSSNGDGFAHTLLHFETSSGGDAAPVSSILGDIGSIVPYIVAHAVVITILLIWNRLRGQPIDWRAKLNGEGQLVASNS